MNAPAGSMVIDVEATLEDAMDIPLLDSRYCADEARQCALQVIAELRKYHRLRNHSHLERFGEPDPVCERALSDLEGAFSAAKTLIEAAERSGSPVVLESSIKLRLLPEQH